MAKRKQANVEATDVELQALIDLADRLHGIDIDKLTPGEVDQWIAELTPPELKDLDSRPGSLNIPDISTRECFDTR